MEGTVLRQSVMGWKCAITDGLLVGGDGGDLVASDIEKEHRSEMGRRRDGRAQYAAHVSIAATRPVRQSVL